MKIANNNEIVLKSNRVTGELVYDLLKDDFEHVDESYLEKYIGQLRDRDNRFLPNQEDFYYISDYEYNVSDNYNGYDDVYYEDNEYYYDEYLDEEYIHESVASDPSHESLILRTTPKYVYYLTSQLTDLYRCDVCEKVFCDYNSVYEWWKKKRKYKDHDICSHCMESGLHKYNFGDFGYNQSKIARTMKMYNGVMASLNQRYIAQLLCGEVNKKILNSYADIYWKEQNIVIEYDGSGHWLSVKYNKLTEYEFLSKERKRESELIKNGYKVIRIESKDDLLPTDKDLIGSLEASLRRLEQKDIDHIKIDKNNFTHLRKVKEKDLFGYFGRS